MERRIKIIIKIEIETLFNNKGELCSGKFEKLGMLCANLQNSGARILLVSSGAIALGTSKLGLSRVPRKIAAKQAAAAVGQAELIMSYQEYFDDFDQMVAQVLITRDVADNPARNINARNTLERLLEKNIIPVINENDSVSTNDIILNDNYPLVLIVASLTDADAILVNTYEAKKFLLILKNSSSIIEIDSEDVPDLSDNITRGKYKALNDITGFPEKYQFAGIN